MCLFFILVLNLLVSVKYLKKNKKNAKLNVLRIVVILTVHYVLQYSVKRSMCYNEFALFRKDE